MASDAGDCPGSVKDVVIRLACCLNTLFHEFIELGLFVEFDSNLHALQCVDITLFINYILSVNSDNFLC